MRFFTTKTGWGRGSNIYKQFNNSFGKDSPPRDSMGSRTASGCPSFLWWRLPHSLAGHCQGPTSAPRVGGSKTFLEAPPPAGELWNVNNPRGPALPQSLWWERRPFQLPSRPPASRGHSGPARVKVFSVSHRLWVQVTARGSVDCRASQHPHRTPRVPSHLLKGGPLARGDPRDVCPQQRKCLCLL